MDTGRKGPEIQERGTRDRGINTGRKGQVIQEAGDK
jgi:hypothetical protein